MFLRNSALLLTKEILVGETPAFLFGKSHFVRGLALVLNLFRPGDCIHSLQLTHGALLVGVHRDANLHQPDPRGV
jgi:hypothetical protein